MKGFIIRFVDNFISLIRYIRFKVFLLFTPICESFTKKYFAECDIIINGKRGWDLQVLDKQFYARVIAYGDLGMGESFVEGFCEVKDFKGFFKRLLKNQNSSIRYSLPYLESVVKWSFKQYEEDTTKTPTYSLPIDYYKCFGDETLTYSTGYYGFGAENVTQAQDHKMRLLASKLQIKPGMRILDVGCGFGGFCKFLATNYKGIEIVGVVNSKEMGEHAKIYCKDHPNVKIEICDFAEVQGKFDGIYVIEMMFHIGKSCLPKFYQKMAQLLNEGGVMITQTYIRDQEDLAVGDFADTYLFGPTYSPTMAENVEFGSKHLNLVDLQDLTHDVKETFKHYVENVKANYDKIVNIIGVKTLKANLYILSLTSMGYIGLFQFAFVKSGGQKKRLDFPRDAEHALALANKTQI